MTTNPPEDRLNRIEAALEVLVAQVAELKDLTHLLLKREEERAQHDRPGSEPSARLKAFKEEMLRHSEEMRRGHEENMDTLDNLQQRYGKVGPIAQLEIRVERIEKTLLLKPIDFEKWEPTEEPGGSGTGQAAHRKVQRRTERSPRLDAPGREDTEEDETL